MKKYVVYILSVLFLTVLCGVALARQCSDCNGTGQKACSTCAGLGYLGDRTRTCHMCNGSGTRTCSTCNGSGYVDDDSGSSGETPSISTPSFEQAPKISRFTFHFDGLSYYLPIGIVGKMYDSSVSISNSLFSGSFSYKVEGLPEGLEHSLFIDTITLRGVPTTTGKYEVTITARNDYGKDSETFVLWIGKDPTIVKNSLFNFSPIEGGNLAKLLVGYNYDRVNGVSLYAEGTTYSMKWEIIKGTLPPGINMEQSIFSDHCYLYGTPTQKGTYYFTIRVSNENGYYDEDFSIVVEDDNDDDSIPTPSATISITKDATLTSGTAGTYYTETLTANVSNSTAAVVWSSTNLPSWLTLNSSTGQLTGKPTSAGTYTFTVTATSGTATDTKTFSITIQAATTPTPTPTVNITITKSSLASGTTGASYNDMLTANISGVTWSVSSGNLPAGLSLNSSTGSITGTPTVAGSYTFTVKATSGASSATKQLSITIQAASSPTPTPEPPTPEDTNTSSAVITTNTLADGTVGTYYSQSIAVSADDSSLTTSWSWTTSSGSLPPGLTLKSGLALRLSKLRTISLSGTPTTAGTYTFTVKATNGTLSASKEFNVNIAQASSTPTPTPTSMDSIILITKASLASGTTGATYNDMLTANISGVTWSVSSWTLPAGLSLNSSTGSITGIPTSAGSYTFTVKATSGAASATKQYTVIISAPATQPTPVQQLQITYTFPNGTVGTLYDDYVSISGGTAPYDCSKTGTLPPGLEISVMDIVEENSSGASFTGSGIVLHGTPIQAGTYTFTVIVKDSQGTTASRTFTVNIASQNVPEPESFDPTPPEPEIDQTPTPVTEQNSGDNGTPSETEIDPTPTPVNDGSGNNDSGNNASGTQTNNVSDSGGGGGGGGCNSGFGLLGLLALMLKRKH